MTNNLLKNKRIAMIIAQEDFRDEELFIPRSIFLAHGAKVKIISERKGKAIGTYGGVVDIDLTLKELKISDFEAIIFVGGGGALKFIDNNFCHQIAKEALSENKILGAICIAPTILARSGVLKRKKATVWASKLYKKAIKILEQEGANYQNEPVVKDGKIVTANGPLAARKFGETIVELLKKYPSEIRD